MQGVQDVGKEAEMSRGKYVKNIDWGKYDKTIVKMRSAGASYRMIAEKIMINDKAVRDHAVKHLGFTVHKKPEDWEILALLEQGMNFREASKKLGYDKKYITNTRCRDPEFKRLTDEARAFGKALSKEIAG